MTLSITDGESSGQHQQRGRISVKRAKGTISVYRCKKGKKGIDAILPLSVVVEMLEMMSNTGASNNFRIYQTRPRGLVSLDAQVPASVAAKMLTAAEKAGVPIRR